MRSFFQEKKHIFLYTYNAISQSRMEGFLFSVLTWSLTFRLSTSTTLFCENEKSCVRMTVPPLPPETQPLYAFNTAVQKMNYEHGDRMGERKAQRLSVCVCVRRKRSETTKSGSECWQGESNLRRPRNNVLGLDLITQQQKRRLAA